MKPVSITLRQVLIVVCAILTITLTNFPNFHPEKILGLRYSVGNDMFFHGGYYFVIALFAFFVLKVTNTPNWFKVVALVIPAIFEATQYFVPGRSISFTDLLANYIGIGLAFAIYGLRVALSVKR